MHRHRPAWPSIFCDNYDDDYFFLHHFNFASKSIPFLSTTFASASKAMATTATVVNTSRKVIMLILVVEGANRGKGRCQFKWARIRQMNCKIKVKLLNSSR